MTLDRHSTPPQPQLDADTAHRCLDVLLDDHAAIEALVVIVRRAWTGLTFDDRREIGQRWPRLADALVRVEGR